jgi:hypothetical protein
MVDACGLKAIRVGLKAMSEGGEETSTHLREAYSLLESRGHDNTKSGCDECPDNVQR